MNPLKWKREHQAALVVAALVGAAAGHIAYVGGLIPNPSVHDLLTWFGRYWLPWFACVAFGALIGAAVAYVLRLARS